MARKIKISSSLLQKKIIKLSKEIVASKNSKAHNVFWGAFAKSLFTQIHKAFKIKSQHGVDNLGEVWADLTPEYKAYKVPPGIETSRQLRARNTSKTHKGILSAQHTKLWKRIFASIYNRLKDNIGKEEAGRIAAGVAWKTVKKLGGDTKLNVFGSRTTLINRRTHRLYNSLEPGDYSVSAGYKKPHADQIFEVTGRKLNLGTSVPYAGYVDLQRPLWSYDIDPWIDKALDDAIQAIADNLPKLLES